MPHTSDQDARHSDRLGGTFNNAHDYNSLDELRLSELTNIFASTDVKENEYVQVRRGQIHLFAGDLEYLGFPKRMFSTVLNTFETLSYNWTRNDRFVGPSTRALDDLAKTDIYKSLYLDNLDLHEILRWYSVLQPVLLKRCIGLMPLSVLRHEFGRLGFCAPFVGWTWYKLMAEELFDFLVALLPELLSDIVQDMQHTKRDGFRLLLLIFQRALPGYCPSAVLTQPQFSAASSLIQYAGMWRNYWILAANTGPLPNEATRCLQMLVNISDHNIRQHSATYETQLEEFTDGSTALPTRLQPVEIAMSITNRLRDAAANTGTRINKAHVSPAAQARLETLEATVRGLQLQVHGLAPDESTGDARDDLVRGDDAYAICKAAFTTIGNKKPPPNRSTRPPRDYTHVCEVCKSQGCAPQGPQGCRWIRGGLNFLRYIRDPAKRAAAEKLADEWAEGSKRRAEEFSKKVAKSAVNYLAHHGITLDDALAQMDSAPSA